jgi:hypothetical protein
MVNKEQIAYMNGPKHRLIEKNGILRHVPEHSVRLTMARTLRGVAALV